MLLKLIGWDIVHVLGGFHTYSEPRLNHLALNQVLPLCNQYQ